jgi:hypothetical protein
MEYGDSQNNMTLEVKTESEEGSKEIKNDELLETQNMPEKTEENKTLDCKEQAVDKENEKVEEMGESNMDSSSTTKVQTEIMEEENKVKENEIDTAKIGDGEENCIKDTTAAFIVNNDNNKELISNNSQSLSSTSNGRQSPKKTKKKPPQKSLKKTEARIQIVRRLVRKFYCKICMANVDSLDKLKTHLDREHKILIKGPPRVINFGER